MPLEEQQALFADALLDPGMPVPEGVVDPEGRVAPKRFAVYRNNVTVSLVEALASAFPTVQKIVGVEFFAAMAREFVRAHPPDSPLLMLYGRSFPDFLSAFEPVAHLSYLADVAQLEQFRREAYHAADADPLPTDFLREIPPDELRKIRFTLHPSVRLLEVETPALSIWEWNNVSHENERPVLPTGGESILIARPQLVVQVRRLPVGGHHFLASLASGSTLGAVADANATNSEFDLSANMAGLMESRIVTAYCLEGTQE